jgi:predicted metal-dependent peptidase
MDKSGFEEAYSNMISDSSAFHNNYLFYACILGQCSVKYDDKMPAPAGVNFMHDHYNLYINPVEFNIFPLEVRLGILKHEMLHILNKHIDRTESREHKLFNIATDCSINQLIEREHLPEGVIYPDVLEEQLDKEFPENKHAEFYYELLKDSMDKCPECDGSGENEDGDTCEHCNGTGIEHKEIKTLDNHDIWKESQGEKDLQQDVTAKMIDKAIQQTEKMKGNLPQNIADYIKLWNKKPEIKWQKVLRGILGNKKVHSRETIRKRNRRFPNRKELKGKEKLRLFDLLVVSDVSGSVSDEELLDVWQECKGICDVTKAAVKLIQVDTEPSKPEELTKSTKVLKRKAMGGTILYPAIEMAKDSNISYNAIVVTTDGYICESDVQAYKATGKKIIWLITSNGEIMDSMNDGKMKAFKLKGKK